MTDGNPDEPNDVNQSDHHKHMDYAQAVITRLANNSFLLKGWALTLSSAVLGFAITQKDPWLAFAAIVPATAFWALDTYYLRQERAFREMYADIAAKRLRDFRIEPKFYVEKQPWSICRSISLVVFYPTIIALTIAVAIVLLLAAELPRVQSPASSCAVQSSQSPSPITPTQP